MEFSRGGIHKSKVEGQDIIVYVTCDNLDEFFNERGTEQERHMLSSVKTLIRYVGT